MPDRLTERLGVAFLVCLLACATAQGPTVATGSISPEELGQLKTGCSKNDFASCRELGLLYENGNRVNWDEELSRAFYARSLKLAEDSCSAGEGKACAFLSEAYWQAIGAPMNLPRALELAEQACSKDTVKGCLLAAELYPKDESQNSQGIGRALQGKAFALSQQGCSQGDVDACLEESRFYLHGVGVAKAPDRGVRLSDSLCTKGSVLGCTAAAIAYRDGDGVEKDNDAAASYYEKACAMGMGAGAACESARDLRKGGLGFRDYLAIATAAGALGAAANRDTVTARVLLNSLQEQLQGNIGDLTASPAIDGADQTPTTSAGTAADGSEKPAARYSGPYSNMVYYLLSRGGSYTLPSCPICTDGKPPRMRNETESMRDEYVNAALGEAWVAAAEAHVGKPQLGAEAAEKMHEYLKAANELCSNSSPVFGGGRVPPSQTLRIWGCPPPMR